MKLATFLAPGASAPTAGEVRVGQIVTFERGSVLDHLTDSTPATGAAYALDEVTLLEPIPRPPAIFCIGRNYAKHIAELGNERPSKPIVFLKLPRSSAPPNGPVIRPRASNALDYETELVLVMGDDNAVAGYAVANDVSARDLQRSEPQWSRAKGFDTSCPWGPWITTKDELPDPLGLRVTTHVNEELRQDGNTRELIFGPEELVAFISEACTLERGALILTGTPSGVGEAFDPPRYLQSGDEVTCEVAGLGRLVHSVTDPS
jgi:acylpyruvate hydrolase